MARKAPNRTANIWVARIIPVILIGIFGYASWVVTQRVCRAFSFTGYALGASADENLVVDYLISPPAFSDVPRRTGVATVILVIYYLLLLPVLICYARLIQTIVTNPGYVPRGVQWRDKEGRETQKKRHARRSQQNHQPTAEKVRASARRPEIEYSPRSSNQSTFAPANNDQLPVEDFWLRDSFVCNYDGRPPYCSTCMNFKPDRAHHCSEIDRCVQKMDHFCPWVGGIVSQTSTKYFIQFCFYAALFCAHCLIFMAYFYAERHRKTGFLDVHWILALGFAAMFLLFSAGMFASTFQLALINTTTIENLSRHTKVWYLAVYMSRPDEVMRRVERKGLKTLRTITYPRPAEEQRILQQQNGSVPEQASTAATRSTADLPIRNFAILESPAGFNPWDCGPLRNLKEVLGNDILDWFLPLKRSPCAEHTSNESMFRLGPQVEKLKQEAGLITQRDEDKNLGPTHRKKRRRRKSRTMSDDEHADSHPHASNDSADLVQNDQGGQR